MCVLIHKHGSEREIGRVCKWRQRPQVIRAKIDAGFFINQDALLSIPDNVIDNQCDCAALSQIFFIYRDAGGDIDNRIVNDLGVAAVFDCDAKIALSDDVIEYDRRRVAFHRYAFVGAAVDAVAFNSSV